MKPQGTFKPEAIEQLYAAYAEKHGSEVCYDVNAQSFAEAYDFMTCERPDGSRYGTGGQCRKGKEVGPKEKKASKAKAQPKVEPLQEKLKTDRDMFNIPKGEQEAARERLLAKAAEKRDAAKRKPVKSETRATSDVVKGLQDRASRGDREAMAELMKMRAAGKIGKEPGFAPGQKARNEAQEVANVKAGKSPVADVKPQKEKLNQVVNQKFLDVRDARELQDVLDNRQINKSQRNKIEAALAERADEVKRVRGMDDEALKKHIEQLEKERYLAGPRYNNARRNLERAKLARLPERVKEAQGAFDKVREESNKNYLQQREARGEQMARLLGKAKGPSAKPQTRNAAGLTKEEYEKQMAAMQAKAAPKAKSKKASPKGAGEALDALATRANRAAATGTYVNKSTLDKMIKLANETGRKIKYDRMPNGNFNVYVQKG